MVAIQRFDNVQEKLQEVDLRVISVFSWLYIQAH